MQNAQRSLQKTGQQMQKVGTGLTLGVTGPLVALGAIALKNFDEQAKAVAQVEQGLRSTGNAVGFTTDQLKKQAAELQNNSLFGDEKILKDATAQLLTFTNIAGEQFSRTQQAALDLATRLDGDLKSASIQLGKALNDPVANLSALSRSGIQFSKEQKTLINSLIAGGQAAKAQSLILDELERQYGGSAKAAAEAGLGPFTQLKNILGDITEDFGAIILEGLKPFIQSLKDIALRFQGLSPETKKFIVILGGIAAAVGPLLALAGTILPAIGTGLALLIGPIGLVIAGVTAIGVAIYRYWEPIKETLVDIANYFIDLYNESEVFRAGVEAIRISFQNMFEVGSFVFTSLGKIFKAVVNQMKEGFRPLGDLIKAILTGDIQQVPVILAAAFTQGFSNTKDLVADLGKDFENLKGTIETNIKAGVERALSGKKYELLASNVDTKSLEEKVKESVQKGIENGSVGGGLFTPQTSKIGLEIESAGVVNPLDGLNDQLEISTTLLTTKIASIREELTAFQEAAGEIALSVGDAFFNMSERFIESLGLASTGFQGFIGELARTVTKLVSILLSNAIANAIAGATQSALATGPGAIFTQPAFIATAVGGVLAAFAAIPKFAQGGIVGGSSFYGDKLIAGVNSGELILNIAQQKSLAGVLSSRTPIILQPSVDMDARKFRVMLNQVDAFNNRAT